MGKQTKRERKFNSSGGVKSRLQKGTILKKGKVKGKKPKKSQDDNASNPKNTEYSNELRQKREDGDFTSEKNLGELDMESFFTTFAEHPEGEDDDDDEVMDQENDDNSDGDSDESGDVEESENESSDDDDDDSDDEGGKNEKKASSANDDSDSEDEDVEAAEKNMQTEMEKLEEKDPEFHQFLQENDEELLNYKGGDDDEDDNEHDMDEDDAGEKNKDVDNSVLMTPALLEKMSKGTFKSHGIKSLKKFVNAFKSACHLADGNDGEKEKRQRGKKYHFESSSVFDRLMVISLTRLHEEFHYHLLGKGAISESPLHKKKDKSAVDEELEAKDSSEDALNVNQGINPKLFEKSRRWSDIKPVLLSFFKSINHILTEAKEPDLVVFVLKSLADFIPYLSPYQRVAELMLKTLVTLWSAPIDASEDYQVVRLHSFLRIRQLALTQPFPYIEECLKKVYLAYAQRAKFANASSVTSSLPTLTFMGNCVVELYSLDYHSSYQHAFVYIRQMALHLRTAMQKKTSEALGAVYCWQYLHCLKLWVAVLTAACQHSNNDDSNLGSGEDEMLRSLIFPLTQVILGTARLLPSTRYLPLRLHCVRLLQQLAAAAEIFLPTTSILLEVFDIRELSQQPKKTNKSNVQPMALTFRLRADNPLRTMEELEMCIAEVFVLLNREVDLYQYSAGFPEFSVRICQRLRKVGDELTTMQPGYSLLLFVVPYSPIFCRVQFSKETRFARWRAYAKGCLDLCERFSKKACEERAKLNDVAPKDVKQLEVLKPINTPSMSERFRQAIEKEKRLEVASRPIQKKKPEVVDNDDDEDDPKPPTKTAKKRKRKDEKTESKLRKPNEGDLEQDDTIEEGINWSDEDDE